MKILVPVDGSDNSMKAVEVARDTAKATGADVVVMTVTPYPKGLDLELSADKWADLESSMTRRGEEVLAKAGDLLKTGGVSAASVIVSSASAADEIIAQAEKEKVDLIVMGKRGLGGKATRFFTGSVASKVSHHSPCSVYLVK